MFDVSTVGICNGLTFLDLIINQIQTLYSKYGCKVPLLLLSKDDTHVKTLKVLEKYQGSTIDVQRIKQGEGDGEGLELESLAGHYSKEEVYVILTIPMSEIGFYMFTCMPVD
ncbi:UTP--glucose-1-phosphate uridylyltransferase-like isoform X2 [Arachis hypogaea]|uniref:UTP--glucose-1-phosphate uridylyltransferase n=1 Tax=Arachis hypogaea TaxID=3818 RepID=A0A445AFL1_ARAHY|nr:hypothetical protein Ahy_B02g058866 isoform B [Arachis hypogaea]